MCAYALLDGRAGLLFTAHFHATDVCAVIEPVSMVAQHMGPAADTQSTSLLLSVPLVKSSLELLSAYDCNSDMLHICFMFGCCRHKGVLQVWVLEAKDLHKQDVGGKADPFVQLQTRVQDLEKTVPPSELSLSCVQTVCLSLRSTAQSDKLEIGVTMLPVLH